MIKIVTDSTAYLRKEEAEAMSIKVVPTIYSVDHRKFFESYANSNDDVEMLLKSGAKLATSQPDPSTFATAFQEELALGNEVLCITISSRLSGTYSAALTAADQLDDKRIVVIDSLLTAGGLYLMIGEAKRRIAQGNTLAQIASTLLELRKRIKVIFSVEDMTPLRNSGRIGFVRASVSTMLNRKPILLCKDGVVKYDEVARGKNDLLKKLLSKASASTGAIIINYLGNNKLASNLYTLLQENFPHTEIKLSKMGPVLGIHLSAQVVAISFIE